MRRIFILVILTFLSLFVFSNISAGQASAAASAQIEYEKGIVVSIESLDTNQRAKYAPLVEVIKIKLLTGEFKGQVVDSYHYLSSNSPYDIKVTPGDRVIVAITHDAGKTAYHISDYERVNYMFWLIAMFALSLILVGRTIGLRSLLVISLSISLVFGLFLPEVLHGRISLAVLSVLVSGIIAAASLIIITGWNRKSLAAIVGAVGGVIIAGILSAISIKLMHLSGLVSEEALLLKVALQSRIDFQGLLFASMMIGALGAIIDTTISISSAVNEIKCIHPDISFWELLKSGMNVGKDTMGMMSNTLILAYMGSSLPLMLLLTAQENVSWMKIVNLDLIVTEITRAITGSIGLIFAIPLTAAVSAFLLKKGYCDNPPEN